MGYTHYWHQKRDFKVSEWTEILEHAQNTIRNNQAWGTSLAWECDSNEPPQADKDMIRFNGIHDEGHETFVLTRKRPPLEAWEKNAGFRRGGNFCKTARKPYDQPVVSILNQAWHVAPDAIELGTDGDLEDGYIKQLEDQA